MRAADQAIIIEKENLLDSGENLGKYFCIEHFYDCKHKFSI